MFAHTNTQSYNEFNIFFSIAVLFHVWGEKERKRKRERKRNITLSTHIFIQIILFLNSFFIFLLLLKIWIFQKIWLFFSFVFIVKSAYQDENLLNKKNILFFVLLWSDLFLHLLLLLFLLRLLAFTQFVGFGKTIIIIICITFYFFFAFFIPSRLHDTCLNESVIIHWRRNIFTYFVIYI